MSKLTMRVLRLQVLLVITCLLPSVITELRITCSPALTPNVDTIAVEEDNRAICTCDETDTSFTEKWNSSGSQTLNLTATSTSRDQNFTCESLNKSDPSQTRSLVLQVRYILRPTSVSVQLPGPSANLCVASGSVDVNVTCIVGGNAKQPNVTYQFYKNNTVVSNHDKTKSTATIAIDVGGLVDIKCRAINSEAENLYSEGTKTMKIYAPPTTPPIIEVDYEGTFREPSGVSFVTEDTRTFKCKVSGGYPVVDIVTLTWGAGQTNISNNVTNGGTVGIKVNKDYPSITCRAHHVSGCYNNNVTRVNLNIKYPPIIDSFTLKSASQQPTTDLTVSGPGPVTFNCSAEGNPVPDIQLFYATASSQAKYSLKTEMSVVVEGVNCEDTGLWICGANNSIGSSPLTSVKLNVKCGFQHVEGIQNVSYSQIGPDSFQVSAQVQGFPKPTFKALERHAICDPDKKETISTEMSSSYIAGPVMVLTFQLDDLGPEDFTKYTVTIDNGVGDPLSFSFNLQEPDGGHYECDTTNIAAIVAPVVVIIVILAAVGAVVAVLLYRRRKRNKRQKDTLEGSANPPARSAPSGRFDQLVPSRDSVNKYANLVLPESEISRENLSAQSSVISNEYENVGAVGGAAGSPSPRDEPDMGSRDRPEHAGKTGVYNNTTVRNGEIVVDGESVGQVEGVFATVELDRSTKTTPPLPKKTGRKEWDPEDDESDLYDVPQSKKTEHPVKPKPVYEKMELKQPKPSAPTEQKSEYVNLKPKINSDASEEQKGNYENVELSKTKASYPQEEQTVYENFEPRDLSASLSNEKKTDYEAVDTQKPQSLPKSAKDIDNRRVPPVPKEKPDTDDLPRSPPPSLPQWKTTKTTGGRKSPPPSPAGKPYDRNDITKISPTSNLAPTPLGNSKVVKSTGHLPQSLTAKSPPPQLPRWRSKDSINSPPASVPVVLPKPSFAGKAATLPPSSQKQRDEIIEESDEKPNVSKLKATLFKNMKIPDPSAPPPLLPSAKLESNNNNINSNNDMAGVQPPLIAPKPSTPSNTYVNVH